MAETGNKANSAELLETIRVRAYLLWERAGRPHGGEIEFWDEARRQVTRETEQAG